jgi:hypothetical protein
LGALYSGPVAEFVQKCGEFPTPAGGCQELEVPQKARSENAKICQPSACLPPQNTLLRVCGRGSREFGASVTRLRCNLKNHSGSIGSALGPSVEVPFTVLGQICDGRATVCPIGKSMKDTERTPRCELEGHSQQFGMTCWRRLREWQEAGIWRLIHFSLLDWLACCARD